MNGFVRFVLCKSNARYSPAERVKEENCSYKSSSFAMPKRIAVYKKRQKKKKWNIKMKAFTRQKTQIHVDYVVTKVEIDVPAFVHISSNRFVCCEKA